MAEAAEFTAEDLRDLKIAMILSRFVFIEVNEVND